MPATKISILTLSIAAIAAITETRAVGFDGGVPAAGAAMKGLAISDAAIGEQVGVDVLGTSIATAGGAFAKGAELEVGAAGKLVAKTTGVVVARAEQAAAADGDKVEVFLLPK